MITTAIKSILVDIAISVLFNRITDATKAKSKRLNEDEEMAETTAGVMQLLWDERQKRIDEVLAKQRNIKEKRE